MKFPGAAAACSTGAADQVFRLPQGQVEARTRVVAMVDAMDDSGFGGCSNEGECEAVCPKGISVATIARFNRDYLWALLAS